MRLCNATSTLPHPFPMQEHPTIVLFPTHQANKAQPHQDSNLHMHNNYVTECTFTGSTLQHNTNNFSLNNAIQYYYHEISIEAPYMYIHVHVHFCITILQVQCNCRATKQLLNSLPRLCCFHYQDP